MGITQDRAGPLQLASAEPGRRRRPGNRQRRPGSPGNLIRGGVAIVVVLALWQGYVALFHPSPLLVVLPSQIASSLVDGLRSGSLKDDIWISLQQFAVGYVIGAGAGVVVGLWIGMSRRSYDYVNPWITLVYITPGIALTPILLIALGFGFAGHVAVIAITTLPYIVYNTTDGALSVSAEFREVGVVYRASRTETFTRILLPGAMSNIFTGLRLGVVTAIIGVVMADFFGSTGGIGFYIFNAAASYSTDQVYVGITILAASGLVFTGLLRLAERRLTPWNRQEGGARDPLGG